MRPVLRGMCRFESAVDGTLDLEHFAIMNDAINVLVENEARIDEAMAAKRGQ